MHDKTNICFILTYKIVILYPNQNTPGVKKVAAKNLKKGCAEKDVKSKWAAEASCRGWNLNF